MLPRVERSLASDGVEEAMSGSARAKVAVDAALAVYDATDKHMRTVRCLCVCASLCALLLCLKLCAVCGLTTWWSQHKSTLLLHVADSIAEARAASARVITLSEELAVRIFVTNNSEVAVRFFGNIRCRRHGQSCRSIFWRTPQPATVWRGSRKALCVHAQHCATHRHGSTVRIADSCYWCTYFCVNNLLL